MKKKILYILITAVLICTAFYIGRNTAPTKTTTKTVTVMPEKVDLSNKDQFNYICDFMAEISDWNCGGGTNDELAVSTKDGYELYAQKQENVYSPDLILYPFSVSDTIKISFPIVILIFFHLLSIMDNQKQCKMLSFR